MAQKIEVVRGTTNKFEILVCDPYGMPYNLGSNEKIVFGIKKEKNDPDPIFQVTAEIIGEGTFNVTISPEHTENLIHGLYLYDVGLDDGTDFFNVIEASPFEIITNVTKRGAV